MILELAMLGLASVSDREGCPSAVSRLTEVDRLRAKHGIPLLTPDEKLAFLLEEPPRGPFFVNLRFKPRHGNRPIQYSIFLFWLEVLPWIPEGEAKVPQGKLHEIQEIDPSFFSKKEYQSVSDCKQSVQEVASLLYLPSCTNVTFLDGELLSIGTLQEVLGKEILPMEIVQELLGKRIP